MYSHDGSGFGTGETDLFLAFKRHRVMVPHLARAHLGSADEEAREWLLVDQAERLLYLAAPQEVRRFLTEQWPRYAAPLEYTPEELERLLADVEEVSPPLDWAECVAGAVRESRANYRLMLAGLDARKGENAHDG